MGGGPEHLLRNGLEDALAFEGRLIRVEVLETESLFRTEIATAFELVRLVSEQVRTAREKGAFPLVLSGNCNNTVGVVAGLAGRDEIGLVWFDGHADFNTPETTTSGLLDGMGLSIAVGQCWGPMAHAIPDFRPMPAENVVLVGGRGADPMEKERLQQSGATIVGEEAIRRVGKREDLAAALDRLRERVRKVLVHLDLDVLDPEKVGAANGFVPEGGMDTEEVEGSIRAIRERFEIVSATVASYDPDHDREGRVLRAALGLARSLTI